MGRMFLSGQTTCALLLGAGLLLRAQAALRPEEHGAAGTRPAEMTGDRTALHPAPARFGEGSPTASAVQKSSHKRKARLHRVRRHAARKCGVALATRGIRCG